MRRGKLFKNKLKILRKYLKINPRKRRVKIIKNQQHKLKCKKHIKRKHRLKIKMKNLLNRKHKKDLLTLLDL